MRALVQRVSRAEVRVGSRVTGHIGTGLLVLLGVGPDDGPTQVAWLSDKLAGLRVFPDEQGKMGRSVRDVGGGILVVSQFTLYGDASKGRRPSFTGAAPPERARPLYERLVAELGAQSGEFGADMQVELVNDGPVTLWLETP
jgi:D-tyrosyl-tRNA(Tyr) deacylase